MTMKRFSLANRLGVVTLGLGLLSLSASGCTTMSPASPFGLASERTPAPPAAPSQYATPVLPVAPPPAGYSTQFASAQTPQARPQRRYSEPPCNTGSS